VPVVEVPGPEMSTSPRRDRSTSRVGGGESRPPRGRGDASRGDSSPLRLSREARVRESADPLRLSRDVGARGGGGGGGGGRDSVRQGLANIAQIVV
jgi:hypothetical protein